VHALVHMQACPAGSRQRVSPVPALDHDEAPRSGRDPPARRLWSARAEQRREAGKVSQAWAVGQARPRGAEQRPAASAGKARQGGGSGGRIRGYARARARRRLFSKGGGRRAEDATAADERRREREPESMACDQAEGQIITDSPHRGRSGPTRPVPLPVSARGGSRLPWRPPSLVAAEDPEATARPRARFSAGGTRGDTRRWPLVRFHGRGWGREGAAAVASRRAVAARAARPAGFVRARSAHRRGGRESWGSLVPVHAVGPRRHG
jgi:hypothetical protein